MRSMWRGQSQLGGCIALDAGRIVAGPGGGSAVSIAGLSLLKHMRRHFHRAVASTQQQIIQHHYVIFRNSSAGVARLSPARSRLDCPP
jgi:hypothetical protein